MNDPMETAKDGITIVSDILKAAGDNPEVKEAGSNLGKTAVTVTTAINNVLLPVAAVNYGFKKARKYFEERFQKDISEKMVGIYEEDLVEPKASIAGPALQGLAFTHEEPSLKEMYLSLLATAMNAPVADDAHPAFVEIIKQLNSDEAKLLPHMIILRAQPIVEVRTIIKKDRSWNVLHNHLMNMVNEDTNVPEEVPELEAMIDNYVRLGLLEVVYGKKVTGDDMYSWVEQRPEHLRCQELHNDAKHKVSFIPGYIKATALGRKFGQAVGFST